MASFDDSPLKKISTGKSEKAGIGKYFRWGRARQDVLPISSSAIRDSDSSLRSSVLSWPPWTARDTPWYENFGLSMGQRYTAFGLLVLGAILLFLLSFIHMPLLILRPGKFVIPFCLANIFLFLSFGFIYGFYSYVRHLFASNRWPFTCAFIGTTFLTLYVAMVMRLYALTFPVAIIQFVSMVSYVVSYIPGGASNTRTLGAFAFSSLRGRITTYFDN